MKSVIEALRETATVLSGSSLSYPKGMHSEIMQSVQYHFVRWVMFSTKKEIQDLKKKLEKRPNKSLQEKLEDREDLMKYLKKITRGKGMPPLRGRISDYRAVAFEVPVDFSDLPQKYGLSADYGDDMFDLLEQQDQEQESSFLVVELIMDKRVKRTSGEFNVEDETLTVYGPPEVPYTGWERWLKRSLSKMGEVVAHELRHFVQLRMQSKKGERAGTPYSPRGHFPGRGSNRDGAAADKQSFPNATDEERYRLLPDEFYPNLETAMFFFFDRFDDAGIEPTRNDFLEYVGQRKGKRGGIGSHPFFMAYKKHAPKLYQKAVKEAWSRFSNRS